MIVAVIVKTEGGGECRGGGEALGCSRGGGGEGGGECRGPEGRGGEGGGEVAVVMVRV